MKSIWFCKPFRPPATLVDAADHFHKASKDFDRPKILVAQRGFKFLLKLTIDEIANDGVPIIPNMSVRNVSLWGSLDLVCKIIKACAIGGTVTPRTRRGCAPRTPATGSSR